MWVVKLGGSLASDPMLRDWLGLLSRHGGGRAVIVPGGGPFTRPVRDLQSFWHFGEPVAHRMALLAMEQYGVMLSGLAPGLVPVDEVEALLRVLRNAGVPVWLPSRMALADSSLPRDWSITSDSLAAWLASQLNAERLVVVKSCALPGSDVVPEELAELGIVDPCFPAYVRHACFRTFVLGKHEHPTLQVMLLDTRS